MGAERFLSGRSICHCTRLRSWVVVPYMPAFLIQAPARCPEPSLSLQLVGTVQRQAPAWYVVLQAAVGLIQLVIALAMLVGYRKAGVWGAG